MQDKAQTVGVVACLWPRRQQPAHLLLPRQLEEGQGGLLGAPRLAEHAQGLALEAQPRVGQPPVQGP